MRLKDKVAIITGGGSGLGRECALLFSGEGARVVVVDRVSGRAKQVAELVNSKGGSGVAIEGDVSDEDVVRLAVDTGIDQFGHVDIMFANAGQHSSSWGRTPIDEIGPEEWQDVLSTNLTGVLWSVKHAVRAMKRNAYGGSIVLTGSFAALRALPSAVLYSVTKAGVNGLAMAVSRDVGRYGIRINTINPLMGMSVNFMLPPEAPVLGLSYEQAEGDSYDASIGAAPLKVESPPTLLDNALSVLFLVSNDSRFITGQSLCPVDGGILANSAMNFPEDWQDQSLERVRRNAAALLDGP
jgi:NAD(P)-dependent dehydrogenase (short-subunit alcohol dehydrogenase family)